MLDLGGYKEKNDALHHIFTAVIHALGWCLIPRHLFSDDRNGFKELANITRRAMDAVNEETRKILDAK